MTPQPLPPEQGIGALVSQVVDDAKAYIAAEIEFYRGKVSAWIGTIKVAAALGVVALILVNAAIIALLVGLILTLQAATGPGWATLIVVGVTVLVAGLLGWLATMRIGKMTSKGDA